MAITDAEKQEIIDALLTEIRANGLDYSGQTITFPDAFNVTQTERQNVKIPAIDERSATPVHGNVDLEALLTAYGVTHVEEIASEIASIYMKKVADSDLNMKGYNITGINRLYSVGNSGRMVIVPNLTSADFGLTSSASMEELFIEYLKWVYAKHTGIGQISFFGTFAKSGQTYGEIKGTILTGANYVDSNGIPTEYTFIATYMKKNVYFGVRDGANEQPALYNISTFPFNNTSLDNRINAFGSDYIRYENGLQICWGLASGINVPVPNAWGGIYLATSPSSINFPVNFISSPAVSMTWTGGTTLYFPVDCSVWTTGMSNIRLARGSAMNAEITDGVIRYMAIGKWK